MHILYGIIKGLQKEKFEVTIICLSKEKEGSKKIDFEKLGCKVINLDNSRIIGALTNQTIIQKFIDSHKTDLVHSHGFRADLINASLKGVRSLTTLHNFPNEDYIPRYGRIKGNLMAVQHKRAIAKIDRVISCSQYIKHQFLQQYGITSQCIQNGIDTEIFKKSTQLQQSKLRALLGLPQKQQLFLICGSLIKRKDPLMIIKAFDALVHSSVGLVFIGQGDLYRQLKDNYASENIIFRGEVNNVTDYLLAADAYISASHAEGLPNAVLEAIGSGLTVILSDIAPHIEIVGETYPFLFRTASSVALKEKMELFIKGAFLPTKISSTPLDHTAFDAREMSKKYQSKYTELCLHLGK